MSVYQKDIEILERFLKKNFTEEKMRKCLIYVSGKYTDQTQERTRGNVLVARMIAQRLIDKGAYIFCPHTHSHGFHGLTHSDWLEMDCHILSVCDAIYMIPNWKESAGAKEEYHEALANNIPVLFNMDEASQWIEKWELTHRRNP